MRGNARRATGSDRANAKRATDRGAIKNSGLQFPIGRVTVNLAPADLRKEGPAYDLPIAVAILAATQQIMSDLIAVVVVFGVR